MIRLSPGALADRYRQDERESIAAALDILTAARFWDFIIAENNRLLVESMQDESPEELAKRILDNRQTNRVLQSIPAQATIVRGNQDNA